MASYDGGGGWDRGQGWRRRRQHGGKSHWKDRGRGGSRHWEEDSHEGGYGYKSDREDFGKDEEHDGGYRRQRGRGRGGRRGGHPSGLKGRDIGLFYAKRSQEKKKQREVEGRACIEMDKGRENHLSNLISNIRAADRIAPQPSRSYKDAFSDSEEEAYMGNNERCMSEKPRGSFKSSHQVPDSWDEKVESSGSSFHNTLDSGEDFNFIKPSTSKVPRSGAPGSSRTEHNLPSPGQKYDSEGFISLESLGSQNSSEENSDLRDDEEDEEELLRLTQETEASYMREPDDDGDDDEAEDFVPTVSEMYKMTEDESDFVSEFLRHNAANRRSQENLNEIYADYAMPRNSAFDLRCRSELEAKRDDPVFQKMLKFRMKLPSYKMRQDILDLTSSNQVVVISGETGCGKTTQVAQFILDDYIERGMGSICRVVCTQPRRISAIAVAERVADERAEKCGSSSVGYQIRLDSKLPRQQGSILYCTTGILLQWLHGDPWLTKTSHVILDEIHERDLQSDFLMIILKELIRRRSDLKLILMSATLNAEMFSQYFSNCPMLNIPGFTYPVEEFVLEDIVELLGYRHRDPPPPARIQVRGKKRWEEMEKRQRCENWITSLDSRKYSEETKQVLAGLDFGQIDIDLAVSLVEYIVRHKEEGAVLVFMPGWDQISKMNEKLTTHPIFRTGKLRIIPLHSLMPTVNQREVFQRPPPGVRKIVIATNIAETSITIDDVVYVIDCGKIKMKNFDPEHNIATLQPEWVSRANAKQRRGRAGRVQPGECYHMYTTYHEAHFEDYQLPEMLRTRLEELCLQIKLLKLGNIEPFVMKAMQPPSMEALHLSVQLLKDLCALDDHEDLTPLGYHLAKMPVDPHTGKMLLFAAMFSCLDPILTIAASLSFKDAFIIPLGKERLADMKRKELARDSHSDHIMLSRAYEGWERALSRGSSSQYCWDNFLSASTLKMLSKMRNQFTDLLHKMKFLSSSSPKASEANKNSRNTKVIKAVICAGLYPNVAKIKNPKKPGRKKPNILETKTDRSVRIHPKSVNTEEDGWQSRWLIYHLKMKTSYVYLYDCTEVPPYPLLFFGGMIDIRKDSGQDCIVVDDWIMFRASPKIAHLMKELRIELDRLLEYKITHPGATNWNPKDKEGALMHAILDLLTSESNFEKMIY